MRFPVSMRALLSMSIMVSLSPAAVLAQTPALSQRGGLGAAAATHLGGPADVTARAHAEAEAFVQVTGNELTLAGRPFRFVGANLSIMHGPDNRAAADDVLAGAARDGLQVGRIWAFGEGAADAAPWIREHFLFRAGPEVWIDEAFAHLDRVIASAARHGVRLIITLSNSWADYGGVPRYLRWAGRWKEGVYGATDRFYDDARVRVAFRAHLERMLARTNQLTGVPYRDDPTILAWELMNESTVFTAAGSRARRRWIVEMATLLHARDPKHLVTPGVSGYRFERERQDWLEICRLPQVDFCDGHIYPEEILRNRAGTAIDAVLDDYVRMAQTIAGKPFVLGEFGVRGDDAQSGAGGAASATEERRWQGKTRAWWTTRLLDRLRFDGAAGGLVWIYQGARGADRAHGISVDTPGARPEADLIRQAMSGAARALRQADIENRTDAARNPAIADSRATALTPLHAEFQGRAASIPILPTGIRAADGVSVTWDPLTFARADWEASGIYSGGALEHAWGGETGWFEYQYRIVEVASRSGHDAAAAPLTTALVRARLSSEYPGSSSPGDGASRFQIALDGVPLGTAQAPPDDGRGRWVAITVPGSRLPAQALAPGLHQLRFTVAPGAHAHGLALYGRVGEKPVPALDGGVVELRFNRAR